MKHLAKKTPFLFIFLIEKSRAAFKLLQINDKFNFLLPGLSVIDLGCAPGGWLQIASEKVSSITGNEKVIGVDILKTDDIAGCKSIIGDINDKTVSDHLIELLGQKPDVFYLIWPQTQQVIDKPII